MPDSNSRKRNLPSWMSSREEESDDGEKSKQQRSHGKSNKDQNAGAIKKKRDPGTSDFSKLMEGVVFVLSGFVNPERGVLRSQMLEMGAEYQPDWNSDCTLLVCAFANTPKFKQVKAEGGTIVSKDWISECYNQKKLVDIETYLLHAGKPWRSQSISHEATEDIKPSPSHRPSKQEEGSSSRNSAASSKLKGLFSASKVKKWAIEDLKRTISWLEDQDEKPEPGEIKKVGAEGILTCLQDAIDALKEGKGIQHITDQWACIPQLIDELARLDDNSDELSSLSKEDLCKGAMVCKQIYELEFLNMEHDHECLNKTKPVNHGSKKVGKGKEGIAGDGVSYDSDATIEMTEEEIDQAYNTVACSL